MRTAADGFWFFFGFWFVRAASALFFWFFRVGVVSVDRTFGVVTFDNVEPVNPAVGVPMTSLDAVLVPNFFIFFVGTGLGGAALLSC